MAFPLGANSEIYNMLVRNLGKTPSLSEYNDAVRWINASSGTNYPIYAETALAPPVAPVTPAATGGEFFTGTGAGGTVELMNPAERANQWTKELQAQQDAAAMARTQVSTSAQLAAATASAQAQLEAQREADRAALERLRYQLGTDLANALMTNDLNKAKLTMDVASLAADPRSTVGFLEYLGKAGGGPTAISQNVAAGIQPSPVWEYVPQTEGYSPEVQNLLDILKGFVGSLGG
jgi:hypothetical protein